MKKVFACFLALAFCLLPTVFSGCRIHGYGDPWSYKKEENGFYYYLQGENGLAATIFNKAKYSAILSLVDSEQEIEELIIPEKLGGYPVKRIGEYYQAYAGALYEYGIEASNINRIVINHNCEVTDYSFENFNGELVINADVSVVSSFSFEYLVRFNIDLNLLTDYKEWAKMWEYDWTDKIKVEFNTVGGEQKTYAIVITKNEKIPSVETPKKSGYTFAGWYTDETYETQWNFEEDTVTQNITLYAKWIENGK